MIQIKTTKHRSVHTSIKKSQIKRSWHLGHYVPHLWNHFPVAWFGILQCSVSKEKTNKQTNKQEKPQHTLIKTYMQYMLLNFQKSQSCVKPCWKMMKRGASIKIKWKAFYTKQNNVQKITNITDCSVHMGENTSQCPWASDDGGKTSNFWLSAQQKGGIRSPRQSSLRIVVPDWCLFLNSLRTEVTHDKLAYHSYAHTRLHA